MSRRRPWVARPGYNIAVESILSRGNRDRSREPSQPEGMHGHGEENEAMPGRGDLQTLQGLGKQDGVSER